jgi:hypothetical protein
MKEKKTKLKLSKVLGCLAFYTVPDAKRIKLELKALNDNFVGYA